MNDTQSRFAALPPRQKASVVIFFIIGAVVIYLIIGMFRNGSSSAPAPITPVTTNQTTAAPAPLNKPVPPQANQAGPSSLPPGVGQGPHPNQAAANPPERHVSPIISKPMVEKALPSSSFLVQQDQSENRYVSAINDLQMLKIQREIAETNEAIVTAKLATVTAEKTIAELLGATLGNMNGPKSAPKEEPNSLPPPPIPAAMAQPRATYTVQSVTMELDQWHAVLTYMGKQYDVSVGDVLPLDGSTVSAIDAKTVTLELGDMKQRLPVTSSTDMGSSDDAQGGGGTGASSPTLAPGG